MRIIQVRLHPAIGAARTARVSPATGFVKRNLPGGRDGGCPRFAFLNLGLGVSSLTRFLIRQTLVDLLRFRRRPGSEKHVSKFIRSHNPP